MNSQIYCKCEHTIDLRVGIIVKDNAQLLDVLEKVNGMDGVNDAVWGEIVQVMGRNTSMPSEIIDLLSPKLLLL
jgi:hypothetical protein